MVELSDCSFDRDKTRKFLRGPMGHYLAHRAYSGSLGRETSVRLMLGMMYHVKERQRLLVNTLVGSPQKLKPEGAHAIRKLTTPWAASLVSPNEEGVVIANSDVMGTPLILDKEKCPFFTGKKAPKKEKVKKPKGKVFYGY